MNRRKIILLLFFIVVIINMGCGKRISREKKSNIGFTIVQQGDAPEELQKLIAEKRDEKFHLTYKDDDEMYICIGYGKQATGGYSIKVKEVYLTEDAVCVDTILIGPNENDLVLKAPSYPYVVIRTECLDGKIIYDD